MAVFGAGQGRIGADPAVREGRTMHPDIFVGVSGTVVKIPGP